MDLFVGIFREGPEDVISEGSLRRTKLNSYLDAYQQVLNLSNEINIKTVLETNHKKEVILVLLWELSSIVGS